MTGMVEDHPLARFHLSVRPRFSDTDLNGHVAFTNYLVYMDEALLAYLSALGHDWRRLEKLGLGIYYVDTGCRFRGQARFEDTLDVHCEIADIGNTSLRAELAIVRPSDSVLIATGHIAAVMIDTGSDRPAPVPESFREAVARYQDDPAP